MECELVLRGSYLPAARFTTEQGEAAVQKLQTDEVLAGDATTSLITRATPPKHVLSDRQLTAGMSVDMQLASDEPYGVWRRAVYAGRPRGKHILLFAGNHAFAEVPADAVIRQSYDVMPGPTFIKTVLPRGHLLLKLLLTSTGKPRYNYSCIKAPPEFGGCCVCSADCTGVQWSAVLGRQRYGQFLAQPAAAYVADRLRLHIWPDTKEFNFDKDTWQQVASHLGPAVVPTPEAIEELIAEAIAQRKPAGIQAPPSITPSISPSSARAVGPVRGHQQQRQQQQQQRSTRHHPYGSRQMNAPAQQRQPSGTGSSVPGTSNQAAAKTAPAAKAPAAEAPINSMAAVTAAHTHPTAPIQPAAAPAATVAIQMQHHGLQLGSSGVPSAPAAAAAALPRLRQPSRAAAKAAAAAGGSAAAAAAPASSPAAAGKTGLGLSTTLVSNQQAPMFCRSLVSAATNQWAHDGRLLQLSVQEVLGVGGNAEVFKVVLRDHAIMPSTTQAAAAAAPPAPAQQQPASAAAFFKEAAAQAAAWWEELDACKAAAGAAAAAEGTTSCSYDPPQLFALKVPLEYHRTAPELQQQVSSAAYFKGVYGSFVHEHQVLARMASSQRILRTYAYGVVQYGTAAWQRLPCLLLELGTGTVQQLLFDHQAAEDAAAAAAAGQPARPVGLPEDQLWRIMRDMCSGLGDLQLAGIVWNYLKLSNILVVTRGGRTSYALCDFGSAVLIGADALEKTAVPAGTPAFMPPELKYGRRVGLACDVWGMGCVLHALLLGRLPQLLPDAEPSGAAAAASWDAAVLSDVKDELKPPQLEFVTACLAYDPRKRPTARALQLHEYLAAAPDSNRSRDELALAVPGFAGFMNTFHALMGQMAAAREAGDG